MKGGGSDTALADTGKSERSDVDESLINVALCLDGPTPLIAAMRCFVASRLGDEVDVPDSLRTT